MDDAAMQLEAGVTQAIGAELLRVAGQFGQRIVFYAEPSESGVEGAVFAGDDRSMVLLRPSTELNLLTRDLWRMRRDVAPGAAWAALVFQMLGPEFRMDYVGAGELDAGQNANERCKEALKRLMGPVRVERA